MIAFNGGHRQAAFNRAIFSQTKNTGRALKTAGQGQTLAVQRIAIARGHRSTHSRHTVIGNGRQRVRRAAINELKARFELFTALRTWYGEPSALNRGQMKSGGQSVPLRQTGILHHLRIHPGLWQQLRNQGQPTVIIGGQKYDIGVDDLIAFGHAAHGLDQTLLGKFIPLGTGDETALRLQGLL